MESEACLLVGGPLDGKSMVIKTQTLAVPVMATGGFGQVHYQRQVLAVGEREYVVYVHDDMPGYDLIGRLIAGYRTPQAPA